MFDFLKTLREILLTQNLISESTELTSVGVNTYKADNLTIEAFSKKDHTDKYIICFKCN